MSPRALTTASLTDSVKVVDGVSFSGLKPVADQKPEPKGRTKVAGHVEAKSKPNAGEKGREAKGVKTILRILRAASPAKPQSIMASRQGPVAENFAFGWPSGSGEEVAQLTMSVEKTWDYLKKAGQKLNENFRIVRAEEDGAEVILIEGLSPTPITVVQPPESDSTDCFIYADRAVALELVHDLLTKLFPPAKLRLY